MGRRCYGGGTGASRSTPADGPVAACRIPSVLPQPRRRRNSRGFSLVETLVALLILGIVITTGLAALYGREARMQEGGQMVLVWQALGNEAVARRHQSWGTLTPGTETPVLSDLSLLAPLESPSAIAAVESVSPAVKKVTLTVSWAGGKRTARAILYRTDTGGGSLW